MLGDSHSLIDPALLPDRDHLSPLYRHLRLTVPPASIEEHYSDWTRLIREMSRNGNGSHHLRTCPCCGSWRAAPRGQWRHHGRRSRNPRRVCGFARCKPATAPTAALGLAVDIGTTTVAAQLVDLDDGSLLATQTSYNLQIRRGADVITRIDYARTPERLEELRSLVLETINALIRQMALAAAIERPATFVRRFWPATRP